MIGLHYFSPVDKMPLVEVIPHAGTSEETIATTVALAHKKTAIGGRQRRVLCQPHLAINEAARCLLEGEPIESLDKALVDFGFPVGPDHPAGRSGHRRRHQDHPGTGEALGPRFAAPAAFDAVLKDGRKGGKNGQGFYLERRAAAQRRKRCGYLIVYAARRHAEGAHATGERRSALRDDDAERRRAAWTKA
ncbi:3-hydroxyacyl-CoA dehydrogenase NAD-binding domain-containing protein [Serratia ureilytica]